MNQPRDYVEINIRKATDATRPRQSRLESILEVSVNIASGFIVSYLIWIYLVPIIWPQHASSHGVAFGITVLFTISSVIRSYVWRRLFEHEVHKVIHSLFRK